MSQDSKSSETKSSVAAGEVKSSDLQIARASEKPAPGSLIMSGMRSTHHLHIGNFHGALKQWLDLQKDYRGFYGVMNWHAMTSRYKEPHEVQRFAREIFAEWIAWGLDHEKNVIFIQSEVPEHIELNMFFMMLTPMSWLERVPTWKDAEEDAKATDTHNLGRFMYPVLQAADIAIYRGTHVPIGQDQIPHLELSREIIRRFNFLYGGNLPEPKPIFSETPTLMGSDGRKMSKSYNNAFNLTQEPDEVSKTLRLMPTDPARVRRNDPGEPTKCAVYSFHKLYSKAEDLTWVESGCRSAGIGCGDCKKKLGENIEAQMAGPRVKKRELLENPAQLDQLIEDGCMRARKEARRQLEAVKEWTGIGISYDYP
ncbi:MAG TPA: tryptophan--tRNA ligase [Pseudobdellovibrionaceae bacterium]|nr:tryptophan--tRNA ligase [Pseudobdellovibrionaceae bacterium]